MTIEILKMTKNEALKNEADRWKWLADNLTEKIPLSGNSLMNGRYVCEYAFAEACKHLNPNATDMDEFEVNPANIMCQFCPIKKWQAKEEYVQEPCKEDALMQSYHVPLFGIYFEEKRRAALEIAKLCEESMEDASKPPCEKHTVKYKFSDPAVDGEICPSCHGKKTWNIFECSCGEIFCEHCHPESVGINDDTGETIEVTCPHCGASTLFV